MQAFRQPPALHHAAGELINQDDFVVFDDVVLVAEEQPVGAQRLVGVVDNRDVRCIVERAFEQAARDQQFLDLFVAGFRKHDLTLFFVVLIIFGGEQRNDLIDLAVEIGAVFGRPRNDQRRARFIDQDRIDFIDDRVTVAALDHLT